MLTHVHDRVMLKSSCSHHKHRAMDVMTQLCEVEVHELKPKYLGQSYKMMKYEFYYFSRTPEVMIYHSRTLSDQRLYEGRESTYSDSEDL